MPRLRSGPRRHLQQGAHAGGGARELQVRRAVAAVEEAAATNPVVVVVFPDHAVTDGTADQILDELSATITSSCGLECADDVFPVRVLASFGARGAELTDYDDWDTIINWTGWHGQTVIVPAWEHPDVSDIINRWIPQPRASTLAPDRIPTLLIATSLEYTDRLVIDRLDPTVVSVHWWWGVFDRLDTELQLSTVTVSRPVGDLVAGNRSVSPCNSGVTRSWQLSRLFGCTSKAKSSMSCSISSIGGPKPT